MEKTLSQIKGTLLLQPGRKAISRAAQIICAGGLVAFPTETVYGLGASAMDPEAVAAIFTAKGRPADNPLIVHVSDWEQVCAVAASVPDRARLLMKLFWPGPLSLILPRSAAVPDQVSAGLPTVAVRMPDHPVALQLIRMAGVPIAAPSANRSGRPSPTSARHVLEEMCGRIEAVLDGGLCRVGVESTVLDLTGPHPVILRPGGVTREALASALGEPVLQSVWKGEAAPPSPGMKYRHYAPRAPLILVTGPRTRRERLIGTLTVFFRKQGVRVCSLNGAPGSNLPEDKESLARYLYRELRRCDTLKAEIILAGGISPRGLGAAVMNRLGKAAARVIRV
jgi:L-threonylcarbamoyladenylate synthase